MKNTLTTIALIGLCAGALVAAEKSVIENLSVKSTVGFESEYVYRAKQLADVSVQASLEGSYKLYNGSLYAGVWTNQPETKSFNNETDLFVGYKFPAYEKLTADVGMTYYWYTESTEVSADRTREIYAGVTYNGLYVNPAVYAYYDFDLKQWVLELSGSYSYDLAKVGVANTSVELGAKAGVLSSKDVNGDQVDGKDHNGYTYGSVNADVAYHFNKSASASVGATLSGNNDDVNGDESNFFWGAKFSAGF